MSGWKKSQFFTLWSRFTIFSDDENNENRFEETDNIEEIPNPTELPSQAIQVVFVSMWYWWQEITIISLITAALMNVLITQPIVQGLRDGFRRRLHQIRQNVQRRPVSYSKIPTIHSVKIMGISFLMSLCR